MTFQQQYEANRPLREEACNKYYQSKVKVNTIEEAEKMPKYTGNWICLVTTPMGNTFYTRHQFNDKWVESGNILGMWNELKLIKKIK